MRAGRRQMLVGASFALGLLLLDAPAAMAQLVQSDVEAEPGATETTQLVTSSTEVRRSVIGLISLAVIVALLGGLYWYKTGRLAAERHAHRYGGKHGERATTSAVGQPSAPVPAVRTDMAGSSFAVPQQPTVPRTIPPAGGGTDVLGGYGTWSTAPESLPGAGPAIMGYAARETISPQQPSVTAHVAPQQPAVTAHVAPQQPSVTAHVAPQPSTTGPRPVWHDQSAAAPTQARPGTAAVPSGATSAPPLAGVQSLPVADHRTAPPQRSAEPSQHRRVEDHPTPARSVAQPQPVAAPVERETGLSAQSRSVPQQRSVTQPAQREPMRSRPSPYPDASVAATSTDSGGLWSTLRRDLFG